MLEKSISDIDLVLFPYEASISSILQSCEYIMDLHRNKPGIYTLILHLNGSQIIRISSLGGLDFAAGFYAYTGSARGPGGLKRVDRHIQVLLGQRNTRRWHIDYLLSNTSFQEVVITETHHDLECRIARCIGETQDAVPGFGCTDCDCKSHLHYSGDLQQLLRAVRRAHDDALQSIEDIAASA